VSNTTAPISRSTTSKLVMTIVEAIGADRQYFDEHPAEEEYIREFVPGEFVLGPGGGSIWSLDRRIAVRRPI
jgi:hypothetical protein